MNEIHIFKYPRVEGDKNSFKVATVFGGCDVIFLHKIPKNQRRLIESIIEDVIEHESLHVVLSKRINQKASDKLDKIIPYTHSMSALCWKLSKKRKD